MLNTKQKKAAQDHLCSEEGIKERKKGGILKLLLSSQGYGFFICMDVKVGL